MALWSLAVLAFERYFVICRPLGNIRLGGKHAALGLLFVWTFSFIWTIPPVLGWSSYTVSRIGTTCEPNWWETKSLLLTQSIAVWFLMLNLHAHACNICWSKTSIPTLTLTQLQRIHVRSLQINKPEQSQNIHHISLIQKETLR